MRKRTKILIGSVVLLAIFSIIFIQNTPQEEKEFTDDSIKARSEGAVRFNPLPEQTLEKSNLSQEEFIIEARSDGATLFIENIPVANFSGYFVKDGLLWDLQFTMNVGQGNVTWKATDLGYNTSVWITNESFDKLKFGSEYFGILPKDVEMVFYWSWYPDVETEFSEGGRVVWIKHPDFVGHHNSSTRYEINYYDLPQNSVISETEARTSFQNTTYFKIDPHVGNSCDTANANTEDDFHDHCHQVVTDTANTNDCLTAFIDYQQIDGGTFRGSFDSPREPANTVRTPIRLLIQGDLNVVAVSASCNVVIRENQSCTSTVLINQTFQLDPLSIAIQSQNSDFVNTTFLGRFGELCVELRANVADAVGGGATAVTAGRIGIAPLLSAPSLFNATINYFQDQTINHSLRQDEGDNITELWLRLVNTSNLVNINGDLRDLTPQNPLTHQLIDFSTNPVPNTNLRYNYTNWTDNARNHSRFSTSSLNAITSPEPAGIWPKTGSFNLTNVIQCSNFVSFDGVSVYNKGFATTENGIIRTWDSLAYTATSGVSFDLQYRQNGGAVAQFSDNGWDVNSTGGWQRTNTIPASAVSGFNFSGLPYDMYFEVNSDNDATEKMSCTYVNTFNVTSLLQVSTVASSVNNRTSVNVTPARYNRGEGANVSFYLFLANGTRHRDQSSLKIWYKDNTTTIQNTLTGLSSNGTAFVNGQATLSTSAPAVKTFLGTPWHFSLIDSSLNMVSLNGGLWNGTENGTFNVSSWYLLNHKDQKTSTVSPQYSNITFPDPNDADQISLVIGFETVYGFNEVINTRNESLASKTASAQAWFPNGTRYNGVLSVATADDGYTTTPLPVTAQAPVGFWTFGGNITHNGNSGEQNHSIKFQNGADSDPLRLSCDEPDVGGNITCILKSTELNGTPLTGLAPQINWTYPNQSSVVLNMIEIGSTGNYRARMNASVTGTYDILANVSVGGGVYWAGFSTFVNQIYSGGGGGGGLTSEQNQTLYDIFKYFQANITSVNDTVKAHNLSAYNDELTTRINSTAQQGIFNNSIIDVLRTWVGSQHVITRDYILNSSGGAGGLTALQNSTLFGIVANVTHNTTLEHWETRRNLTAQQGIFNESISNAVTGVRTTVNSIQTTANSIQTTLNSLDTFIRTAWGDFTANSLRANITGNISSHHVITREYVINSSSNVSGNISVNATQIADAFCNRVQSVNATGFQRTVCYQINKTFINRGVGA